MNKNKKINNTNNNSKLIINNNINNNIVHLYYKADLGTKLGWLVLAITVCTVKI